VVIIWFLTRLASARRVLGSSKSSAMGNGLSSGSTVSSSDSWIRLNLRMLCSTAHAYTMLAARAGSYMRTRYFDRHLHVPFKTPKHRSTAERALQCASVYRLSLAMAELGMGVISHGSIGYPASPVKSNDHVTFV